MKKCKFYSQIMGENHQPIAKLQDGWTDVYFNYYCNTYAGGHKTWYAIEPSTGLSVAQASTRKKAQEKATTPAMLKLINEKVTQDMIQRFFELKTKAEAV